MSTAAVLAPAVPSRRIADLADGLLVFAVLFSGSTAVGGRMLGDPDSHWHVAVGRRIWEVGAVPWTDSYSHTFAGAPWIAKEWLSQLILFAAQSAAGWAGVVAVAAAAIGLVFALLFTWLARRLRPEAALALTVSAALLCVPHFLARPHVFAFVTLFLWMRSLLDAAEGDGRPPWPALAVLVLWANLHGSFTIAYPLAGLVAAEAVLRAPAGLRVAAGLRWGAFGTLALGAGCVSPYGIHALLVTVTIFGSGESLPFIDEWQPLELDAVGIATLASAAAAALLLALEPRRNLFRLLALAMLAAMCIRHVRFVDVYTFAAPMLAAAPVARRVGRLAAPPTRSRIIAPPRWPALAPLVLVALAFLAVQPPRPSAQVTPDTALAAARRAGLSGPVYNDYDFGGFLMAEEVPTFVDGRTDQLYLGGFISTMFGAVRAPDGTAFLALLDRYGVTWALVRAGSPESRHLDAASGWRPVHTDATAKVYARR